MNPMFLNNEARILLQLKSRSMTRSELGEKLGFTGSWIGKSIGILISQKLVEEDVGYRCPHCKKIIDSIRTKKGMRTVTITEKGLLALKEIES